MLVSRMRDRSDDAVTTAPSSESPLPAAEIIPLVSTAAHSATVTVTGHLMDTGILARILDDVLEYGGDYRIESLDLGRQHEDESRALVEISADEADLLDRILMRVQVHGANPSTPGRRRRGRPPPTASSPRTSTRRPTSRPSSGWTGTGCGWTGRRWTAGSSSTSATGGR